MTVAARAGSGRREAGRVPRSRRHAHRGARLPRSAGSDCAVPVVVRARSTRLRDAGFCAGARHQPGGRRARLLRRSVRPGGARASGGAARARRRSCSTDTITARTIRRAPSRRIGVRADAASRRPGWSSRPRAIWTSTSRARSSSATSGSTSSWRSERRRARHPRADGLRRGHRSAPRRRGVPVHAVVDTLADAVGCDPGGAAPRPIR